MTATKTAATRTTAKKVPSESSTAGERAAIKERAPGGQRSEGPQGCRQGAEDVQAVLGKIAEMYEPDRSMAERVNAVITVSTPSRFAALLGDASARQGRVVGFNQNAAEFKARCATLGVNDPANLDDGEMWPTAFSRRN
jgi:hypothetical protein